MGLLDLLRKLKTSDKEMRVLVLGLDNAGKTSILRQLSDEDPQNTQPTQGFNIKSLERKAEGIKLHVWDIGGQKAIRPYWRNYYEGTDVLVYVVDSGDSDRFAESAEELTSLMKETKLAGVPVLVLANKQDLMSAVECGEVFEALALDAVEDRNLHILGCSAESGEGLDDALEWIVSAIETPDEAAAVSAGAAGAAVDAVEAAKTK